MSTFLLFTILGLVTGATYAIAASGLVVTYTTSGIFNFAHGAIGMFMAFVFWQLTQAWGWPAFLSLLLVVLVIILIETVGAVCVLLGMWTRLWATAMAVLAAVWILTDKLPNHASFEVEALLLAGSVTLMALGDGPLSIGIRFKKTV